MGIGLAGFLVTAAGVALVAAGYFYFDFSLWLMIPGAALALIGLSLLNGAQEQMLARFRHRVSDSHDRSGSRKEH